MDNQFIEFGIPKEEFQERIRKLLEEARKHKLSGIIVLGSSSSPENLIYLSNYSVIGVDMSPYAGGFGGTGWHGAFIADTKTERATLVVDRDYWVLRAKKLSWIDDLRGGTDFWGMFGSVIREKGLSGKIGVIADGMAIGQYNEFLKILPANTEIFDLNPAIKKLRAIKSKAELEIMKQSIAMQIEVYKDVTPLITDGVAEWEIAEKIRYGLRKREAAHAPSICILSGPNCEASLAYPQATARIIRDGDMILTTVFSYYKHYTTGIDRPFVCGQASDVAKKFSEIEKKGLELAISMLEPGLVIKDLYKPVYFDYIIPELDGNGFTDYKVQGYMGHGTGLSSAETPMLNQVDDTVLEPGMIVHIEPGIYLPGKEMGLRTAEMVIITESGCEILSKDLPLRVGSLA